MFWRLDLLLSSGRTGKGENQLQGLRLAVLKGPIKVGSFLSTFHIEVKADLSPKTLRFVCLFVVFFFNTEMF